MRIVVGFAAGGGSDIIARVMGQWLSERTGQPFVIENRPGAGTNIATEAVVRAPACASITLLLVNSSSTVNAAFSEQLNFNFVRDIAPVGSISREASVMVINPSVPSKTVPDFIAYAKASPGKTNIGLLRQWDVGPRGWGAIQDDDGHPTSCTCPIAAVHPR